MLKRNFLRGQYIDRSRASGAVHEPQSIWPELGMRWCKVALSSLLVSVAFGSVEVEHGSHQAEIAVKEAPIENTIPVEHLHDAHAEHHEPDEHDVAQRFKFGYKIIDKYGNRQVREEEADEYNNRKGYYSFIDHDGIHRKVEYIADSHGFRATVVTNEPGTAPSHPAQAKIIANPATQLHNGEDIIEPRLTPTISKEASVLVPRTAPATHPVASIAHVARVAAIAVPVSHEKLHSAPVVPEPLTHNFGFAKLAAPNYAHHRHHPSSYGHNVIVSRGDAIQASHSQPTYYTMPYGKIGTLTTGCRGQLW